MDNSDPLNKEIQIAIPTETYYRDAYREMAVQAELEGDDESAKVLKYISDDEQEHHELLEALRCRRQPDMCKYGPGYEHSKDVVLMTDEQTIQDIISGDPGYAASSGDQTIGQIMSGDPPAAPSEAVEAQSEATEMAVQVTPVLMPQESTAAEHFGRAICLGRMDKNKPEDQLTPDEQKCVTDVGMGWENAIIGRFETRVPATSINENASLIGTNGNSIGRLTLQNGVVSLCLNTGANNQPITPRCADIGSGFDSFITAQQILDILGVEVQSLG